MLYLVTGTNGAGKTLNTLKWVRDLQLKENRPVAYNGRFDMLADFGWKKIEAKDWQAEPDGTIFLMDECHNDFPVRGASAAVPEHVRMLAEHRKRGFDFFLITQHPQNIDLFIRRLIGSPGWHRHLKRPFGGALVTILEWSYVNGTCEKPNAGKDGTVTRAAFPKEVFEWYKSASLHTGKKKIPKRVWVMVGCFAAVPLMIWGAVHYVTANVQKRTSGPTSTTGTQTTQQPGQNAPQRTSGPLTTSEYLKARTPRIGDFPHTAPAFDTVTQPTEAPYPAACVQKGPVCKCYTQQATTLKTPHDVCIQIVQNGFFMDWKKASAANPVTQAQQPSVAAPIAAASATSSGTTGFVPAQKPSNTVTTADVVASYR